jgi:membrane-associated protease RseP (regulator of RpoE activity)
MVWRLGLLTAVVVLIGLRGGLPWLGIIAAIVVMIFLHELGHYLTAKWAGMKVTQFFLGFGPRIWSVQRGETEYGIKAIPAGAYVKVIGMYNIDEVDPADEARTYRQGRFHQRVIMAAAGSTMHFLLALVLIYGVLAGIGRQHSDNWTIGEISPGSAAAAAGLEEGDRLISVGGVAVQDWSDMRAAIVDNKGETLDIVLVRDGAPRTVPATIGANPDRPSDGQLGVGPTFAYERVNPLVAVPETAREFGSVTWASLQGMARLFTPSGLGSFADQVADGGSGTGGQGTSATDEDAQNRFISIYGAARLGVGLFGEGWAPVLWFLAMLNIFIGIFNLVPLLPFDGGHIAIAVYERLQEWRTGARRHFTDVTRLLPLTYAVVVLLVAIGVSSIYLDVVNPINLP